MDTIKIDKWRNFNKHLFYQFPNEWVGYNSTEGILAHHSDRKEVVEKIISNGYRRQDFVMEYIHAEEVVMPIRIRPIRIKMVKKHDWTPKFTIGLQRGDILLEERMLIDSGADISVISKQVGIDLGLNINQDDYQFEAQGVGGGTIIYLTKVINVIINEHTTTVPVAWLLDANVEEMIIGREVIFDAFDIEFKQADEEIIFRKRVEILA
jgi:gag-polyprotein putative aspartyl protease